jgi:RNA polymerase sigma-70 factor (ECF subfamily)
VQVTRRLALNRRRGAKAEDAHDDEIDTIASEEALPDESQWLAHRRAVLRTAVDALPEAQRQALSLAVFDELTHEQVARLLGTPVGTTKTRIRLALKRLAPVILAALAVVAIAALARWREEASRNEEALRMVTASDVVPLHLRPTAEAPPDAHGNYRSRAGASLAVLTTSHLPQLSADEAYVAWAHGAEGWERLGQVAPGPDGRSLRVVTVGPHAAHPDELTVTREGKARGNEPRGPVLLEWRSP